MTQASKVNATEKFIPLNRAREKETVDLGWKPRAWQRDMFDVLRDNHHAVFVIHRRAGKTEGLLQWMVHEGLKWDTSTNELPPRLLYCAPTQRQANEIVGDRLARYHKLIKGSKLGGGEQAEFTLPNGAQILVRGLHNPDNARGNYIDICVLDEYAYMNPSAFQSVLMPQLLDRNGRAIFCSTPAGRNEFWRIYNSAANGDLKGYGSLFRSLPESGVFTPEKIEEIKEYFEKRDLLDKYETEFMCNFDAPVPGAIWGKIIARLRTEGKVTDVPHDPTRKVIASWDLGVRDDTAIWFWQVGIGGSVRVIDYEAGPGISLADWLKIVNNKPYDYELQVVPHDAKQRDKLSLVSFELFLKRQKLRHYVLPKENPQVRIEAGRNVLQRAVFDKTKCARGLEALALYQREFNGETQAYGRAPRHDWTSHAADAFGYGAIFVAAKLERKNPASKASTTGVVSSREIDSMLRGDKDVPLRQMSRDPSYYPLRRRY